MINNISTLLSCLIFSCLLYITPLNSIIAGDLKRNDVEQINHPDWFNSNPFYELKDELRNANNKGKIGLMVLFTTKECLYSQKFIDDILGDPDISSTIKNNFNSIGLDIFSEKPIVNPRGKNMSINEFSKKEKTKFSPTLVFYGYKGKRLLRVSGYQTIERFKKMLDYLTSKHYRIESFSDHLRHRVKKEILVPPTFRTKYDPFFVEPSNMLKLNHITENQPILVLFDKKQCRECDIFRDSVLGLNKIRNLLGKFKIVRLDATDNEKYILTPNGNRTTPSSWFIKMELSQLPALVFINNKGSKVLKTDSLIMPQQMINYINFVTERAYNKDWSFQQYIRSKRTE